MILAALIVKGVKTPKTLNTGYYVVNGHINCG